eukprot:4232661-Pyramimonas_sp.AAC.1
MEPSIERPSPPSAPKCIAYPASYGPVLTGLSVAMLRLNGMFDFNVLPKEPHSRLSSAAVCAKRIKAMLQRVRRRRAGTLF